MSRLSSITSYWIVVVFTIISSLSFGQQKQNDFTKRVTSLDGKLNDMSSKRLNTGRINGISSQRFSVIEWPSRFSSFGGKRFPMNNLEIKGSERVKTSIVPNQLSRNQKFAQENFERVDSLESENRKQAVAYVEFRDAYYAELDKRVDDWMNKVNNMSLRDINRFQFRKGRSSEPGFPVQKAGSEGISGSNSEQKLNTSNIRSVPQVENNSFSSPQKYWLGPRKVESSYLDGKVTPTLPPPSKYQSKFPRTSVPPKPVLGPKKIRVQVK